MEQLRALPAIGSYFPGQSQGLAQAPPQAPSPNDNFLRELITYKDTVRRTGGVVDVAPVIRGPMVSVEQNVVAKRPLSLKEALAESRQTNQVKTYVLDGPRKSAIPSLPFEPVKQNFGFSQPNSPVSALSEPAKQNFTFTQPNYPAPSEPSKQSFAFTQPSYPQPVQPSYPQPVQQAWSNFGFSQPSYPTQAQQTSRPNVNFSQPSYPLPQETSQPSSKFMPPSYQLPNQTSMPSLNFSQPSYPMPSQQTSMPTSNLNIFKSSSPFEYNPTPAEPPKPSTTLFIPSTTSAMPSSTPFSDSLRQAPYPQPVKADPFKTSPLTMDSFKQNLFPTQQPAGSKKAGPAEGSKWRVVEDLIQTREEKCGC